MKTFILLLAIIGVFVCANCEKEKTYCYDCHRTVNMYTIFNKLDGGIDTVLTRTSEKDTILCIFEKTKNPFTLETSQTKDYLNQFDIKYYYKSKMTCK